MEKMEKKELLIEAIENVSGAKTEDVLKSKTVAPLNDYKKLFIVFLKHILSYNNNEVSKIAGCSIPSISYVTRTTEKKLRTDDDFVFKNIKVTLELIRLRELKGKKLREKALKVENN
jgi:hypothetical protein